MVQTHGESLGTLRLCDALGLPRATFYRQGQENVPRGSQRSPRRLPDDEEQQILNVLNSERFCDMAPAEVFATLLDEGIHLCSERTTYRLLERSGENVARRQRPARSYPRPELLATRVNEVWTWDITKLKGPAKWTYYYLYTILDIFSRYVVGWLVADRESAELAEILVGEACLKQEILPGTLTLHADRGGPMKSQALGHLLSDLGITKSHSRPHVSDDNPYMESAYKTLKYRPTFPERFPSVDFAQTFCHDFFGWYNNDHHHSGIGMLTPSDVHWGRAEEVLRMRQETMGRAFKEHPERFVKGRPVVGQVPTSVWINKPISAQSQESSRLITIRKLSHSF